MSPPAHKGPAARLLRLPGLGLSIPHTCPSMSQQPSFFCIVHNLSLGDLLSAHMTLSAPPLIRPASVFLSLTSCLSMADFTPPPHSLWLILYPVHLLGPHQPPCLPGCLPHSLLGSQQGTTFLLGLNSTALSLGFFDQNSLQSLGLTSQSIT